MDLSVVIYLFVFFCLVLFMIWFVRAGEENILRSMRDPENVVAMCV